MHYVLYVCGQELDFFSELYIMSIPRWVVKNMVDYLEKRGQTSNKLLRESEVNLPIGLYRDVWIAAIASSRTSLATLTGVMCNTSQCELHSLRVNSGMLNVIRIVTYYILPPLESPDSFWIAMAFSR